MLDLTIRHEQSTLIHPLRGDRQIPDWLKANYQKGIFHSMSTWRPDFQPTHLYFITTKAVGYAHVFKRDVIKRLLLDTFDSFRLQKRWKLYCFVIMPNHFHCIA